jgi:hypothetical protein
MKARQLVLVVLAVLAALAAATVVPAPAGAVLPARYAREIKIGRGFWWSLRSANDWLGFTGHRIMQSVTFGPRSERENDRAERRREKQHRHADRVRSDMRGEWY